MPGLNKPNNHDNSENNIANSNLNNNESPSIAGNDKEVPTIANSNNDPIQNSELKTPIEPGGNTNSEEYPGSDAEFENE